MHHLLFFLSICFNLYLVKINELVPVPQCFMQADDDFLFFFSVIPSLDIWPQIIQPSQSATFATPL
jgi:hypothetical protein